MKKLLLILFVFLFLINNSLAFEGNGTNINLRFEISDIIFNSSEERGYGIDIVGRTDKERLGILLFDISNPIVTLISPDDVATVTSIPVSFKFNITDDSSIKNCSLISAGNIIKTNSTITKNVVQTIEQSFGNSLINWTIRCTDSYNQIGEATARALTINVREVPGGGGGGGRVFENITEEEVIEEIKEKIEVLKEILANRSSKIVIFGFLLLTILGFLWTFSVWIADIKEINFEYLIMILIFFGIIWMRKVLPWWVSGILLLILIIITYLITYPKELY